MYRFQPLRCYQKSFTCRFLWSHDAASFWKSVTAPASHPFLYARNQLLPGSFRLPKVHYAPLSRWFLFFRKRSIVRLATLLHKIGRSVRRFRQRHQAGLSTTKQQRAWPKHSEQHPPHGSSQQITSVSDISNAQTALYDCGTWAAQEDSPTARPISTRTSPNASTHCATEQSTGIPESRYRFGFPAKRATKNDTNLVVLLTNKPDSPQNIGAITACATINKSTINNYETHYDPCITPEQQQELPEP